MTSKIFFNKIKIVIVFSFFLLNKNDYSQTVYSNKVSSLFSFTVGLNGSNRYRDTVRYDTGFLPQGGFIYTFSVSDKANIGVEALFSLRKINRNQPTVKYIFYYIDIPVYFQYKFNDDIRAHIGLQYSKCVASNYYHLDGSTRGGVHKYPFSTNEQSDYGILIGTEFDLIYDFVFGIRYSISAVSFLDKTNPYFGVFQVSFNYKVHKGYKELFKKKLKSQ